MTFDDEARRAATALRESTASVPVPGIDELHAPRRSRGRTVLIAAACALVVALVAGALTIGGSSRHGKRVTTTVLPGTWERIPFPATGFEATASVGAIVQGGPGLVAVGSIVQPAPGPLPALDRASGAAWVSSDGRRWRRAALPTTTPTLSFVVATPRGLFAIGTPPGSEPPSTVLHSDDGTHWEVLTRSAPAGLGAVVAGGPGLVAVGNENGETIARAAIWSSSDGRTWTRAPGGSSEFPLGTVFDVAARPGALVAVGSEYGIPRAPAARPTTLVWTSTDGVHWDLRRDPLAGGVADTVGVSGRGFLIAGSQRLPKGAPTSTTTTTRAPAATPPRSGSCSATMTLFGSVNTYMTTWTSPDGREWTPGAAPTSPLAGDRPLVAAHGWWIAGGNTDDDPATGMGAATWVSPDGVTWVSGFTGAAPAPGPCGPQLQSVRAGTATASGAVLATGIFGVGLNRVVTPGPDILLWTPPRRD